MSRFIKSSRTGVIARTVIGPPLIAFIVGLLMIAPAAQACTQYQGDAIVTYVGGQEQHYGSAYPVDASATVTSYNPSPVYSSTSAWVMLANQHYSLCANDPQRACFSQVGWDHWNTGFNGTCPNYITNVYNQVVCPDGYEHVFFQWASPSYVSNEYIFNVPSNSYENFEVYHFNGYNYYWNEGSYSSSDWGGADTEEYYGEVHDWSLGTYTGSHTPGDRTTPVWFSSIRYRDQYGNVYVPQLYYSCANQPNCSYQGSGNGISNGVTTAPYEYMGYGSGADFYIWDNRCG